MPALYHFSSRLQPFDHPGCRGARALILGMARMSAGEEEARRDLEHMLRELQEMGRVLSSVLENWDRDVEPPSPVRDEVVREMSPGLRRRVQGQSRPS